MSKIQSINLDMKELHDKNNELYEHLIDDETDLAIKAINSLTRKLKDIKTSLLSNVIN